MQIQLPENLVFVHGEELKTNSLKVASAFEKKHFHVMRDIKKIKAQIPDSFAQSNFGLVEYIDGKGQLRPMYEMTKDGFMLLVMGYNTEQAMQIKVDYINAFNRMQDHINELNNTIMVKLLTALEAEKQSFAIASMAGRIMRQRRNEKPIHQQQIASYIQQLQPSLNNFEALGD
jgi:Rha family phage regulatory protein